MNTPYINKSILTLHNPKIIIKLPASAKTNFWFMNENLKLTSSSAGSYPRL